MRRKKETSIGRQARHDFYREVLDAPRCYFQEIHPHKCEGPSDPCHLLSKQKIKKIALDRDYGEGRTLAFLWDHRNGVAGCRAMHTRMDNGFLRVYCHQLPVEARIFARDWEVEWEMKQVYREAE